MQERTQHKVKVGLLGGTFNPVHLGHLRAAEEVREAFHLSRVIFIPASVPPHKKSTITPVEQRCDMVKLAIQGNPYFELSEVEASRTDSSYSFETIAHFKATLKNAELFFIMGADAFREIHTWRRYPDFFSACNFIIMSRPGAAADAAGHLPTFDRSTDFTYDENHRRYIHTSGFWVSFCSISLLDISSSEIRRRYGLGRSITYLVPEAVERYIQEHGLS